MQGRVRERLAEVLTVVISQKLVKTLDGKRAMAKEAEAERERRAKVISAEGELQRSSRLAQASNILASSPSALQLAYLQTLTEIAGDKTNTILFPMPMDLLKPFIDKNEKSIGS